MEDNLWWKTTFVGRRLLVEDDPCMLPSPLCGIFGTRMLLRVYPNNHQYVHITAILVSQGGGEEYAVSRQAGGNEEIEESEEFYESDQYVAALKPFASLNLLSKRSKEKYNGIKICAIIQGSKIWLFFNVP